MVIKDNGPGLWTTVHPNYEKAIAEIFLTELHVGHMPWPDSIGYQLPVTNAASTECHFQTRRDGHVWEQSYQAGEPTGPFTQIRELEDGESTGNTFSFTLDPTVFDAGATISYADMVVNLREIAYLLPELKITLRDERQNPIAAHEFHYPNGLTDFMEYLNRDCKTLHDGIHCTDEIELRLQACKPYPIKIDFAIQFTDCDAPFQLSFVNLGVTSEGGTHVDALQRAVVDAIRTVANEQNLPVPSSVDELIKGMTAVVHIQHPDPFFVDLTKQQLINIDARIVDLPVFWAVSALFRREKDILLRLLARTSSRALPTQERRYNEFASQVNYRFITF